MKYNLIIGDTHAKLPNISKSRFNFFGITHVSTPKGFGHRNTCHLIAFIV